MITSVASERIRSQRDAIARVAADLLASGSLEMNADRAGEAREIATLLPGGTAVYVNHLARYTLDQIVEALVAARNAGLEPVPHVAARRMPSRAAARSFLEAAVRDAGVRRLLLIGGDDPQPKGPYADASALLRDGVLAGTGIREIGLPSYPEGHPRIPGPVLARSLDEKLALAAEQDLSCYLVTQFAFAPTRVLEHCSDLARRRPLLPVYVGIAGPTDLVSLMRYAQRCGVSSSLRALKGQGFGAARLVMHTDPGEQITAVAHYCHAHAAACNVVGVHMFSFGGVAKTAEWINRLITSGNGG